MCYTSDVVEQLRKGGINKGDLIKVVKGRCGILQGYPYGKVEISKGERGFKEKCHEGENPRKGMVVVKGHMQREAERMMGKEGG